MAKYDVKFSCGHIQTVELLGKEVERRKKIAFYEEKGLCRQCYQKTLKEPFSMIIEDGCMVFDLAESVGSGKDTLRRVKTGYKNGQMTYRNLQDEEDFTARIPVAVITGSEKQKSGRQI